MRDAINALESALAELENARAELPEDLRGELDGLIEQARSVVSSLRASASPAERSEAASAPAAAKPRHDVVTADEDRAGATG